MNRWPCETCDFIGPELPTMAADGRALHRELAIIGHALMGATRIPRLIDWIAGRVVLRSRPSVH